MSRQQSMFTPLVLILAVVVSDQATKWWILQNFSLYESHAVLPGFFNLTYVTNTGAAFGMLAGEKNLWRQMFFVTVSVVALLAMFFAFRHFRSAGRLYGYAIGLIAGGAVGNLIDRLRFGSVVDFLDFHLKSYHWPAFNVADSAITVGVRLFLLGSFICPVASGTDGKAEGCAGAK